jgi:hypothetical protein
MRQKLVGLIALACVFVAAGYVGVFMSAPSAAPAWAPMALAIGANGLIMTLMALGAVRHDTMPRALAWTFVGLFVLCAGAFVVALLLPAREGAGGPLLLGLPLRTAIVLYTVGVIPIGVLPFAYALTFESSTLSESDIARVRAGRDVGRVRKEAA